MFVEEIVGRSHLRYRFCYVAVVASLTPFIYYETGSTPTTSMFVTMSHPRKPWLVATLGRSSPYSWGVCVVEQLTLPVAVASSTENTRLNLKSDT